MHLIQFLLEYLNLSEQLQEFPVKVAPDMHEKHLLGKESHEIHRESQG